MNERQGLPSASGMDRLINCPGSFHLESIMPDRPVAAVTEQGSRIALARETGDTTGLSDEERDIYERLCLQENELYEAWLKDFNLDRKNVMRGREEREWICDLRTMQPIASAKYDTCYICGEYALVIDDKTGFLDVTEAEKNRQMRTQAVAIWQNYDARHVRVAINHVRFRGKIDTCDYSTADLGNSYQEIVQAVWRAKQPDAPKYPGEWCRYCKGKEACPTAAAWSLVPNVIVGEIKAPTDRDVKGLVYESVKQLTTEQCVAIFERSKVAKHIFDAVTERLKSLPQIELESLGYQLKPTGANRSVKDAQKLYEILAESQLVTQDEYVSICKPNVGEVEKLIVPRLAKRAGTTKEKARELARELIRPAIEETEKSPTLAKVKDK